MQISVNPLRYWFYTRVFQKIRFYFQNILVNFPTIWHDNSYNLQTPKTAVEITLQNPYLLESQTESKSHQHPEMVSLIDRCLQNDRAAQEKLYKQYFGKNMALCMRFTKNNDDAMEMLNTGFLKVFQNLHRYNYSVALGTWIYNIVRNCCIDHLRSNLRFANQSATLNDNTDQAGWYNEALDTLAVKELLALLQSLPATTGAVFNLVAIEGYSHKETAELFGISEGTSKWHVAEARKLLKQRFNSTLNNNTK